MRNPNSRSAGIGRILALVLLSIVVASPAWGQFGALKKAMKNKAAEKAVDAAAPDSPPASGAAANSGMGGDNSTIVLSADVVDRLLTGLRAGKAEREKAAKEDSPVTRYDREAAAYEAAVAKCEQAKGTYSARLASDEKLQKKSQAMFDKMMAAAEKQDRKSQEMYGDSVQALIDPSCTVKQPNRPSDYWDVKRAIDTRADQANLKASGFTGSEMSMINERLAAILQGAEVPGGASDSEKAAVSAHDRELKSLLGIRDAQEGRIAKQVPSPAPAPVAQPDTQPVARIPAGAAAMNACMAANAQKYQKELEGLSARAEKAQKAGDQATLLAVGDSTRKLTMAGCGAGY